MIKLTSIDKNEVLRYLGYNGTEIDERLNRLIEECMNQVIETATPRFVYRAFDIGEDMTLENTIFKLKGNDIKEHLSECKRCVLMAVTMGMQVENIIKTAEVRDMARAVILDSCATTAAEQTADMVQAMIEKENEGKFFTERYSPGYGDMPMESQHDFAAILDTGRKIGLSVTENNILLPRKSITAIIGISDKKTKKRKSGCENCSLHGQCNFRKEGRTCDSKR